MTDTEKIQVTAADAAEALGIGAIREWHVDTKTGSLCIEHEKTDAAGYKPFKPVKKVAVTKKKKAVPEKTVKPKSFLERVLAPSKNGWGDIEKRPPFGSGRSFQGPDFGDSPF